MTNNDYWVVLVGLALSPGGATASPPGLRAVHEIRFSPDALFSARERRRGPAAEREAVFNKTGFTGPALHAMIEQLPQELALKTAEFTYNQQLLVTEAPPTAARTGGPGRAPQGPPRGRPLY